MQPGEQFHHWSFECAEEYFVSFFMMCAVCCAHSLADSPKGVNGEMLRGASLRNTGICKEFTYPFFLYVLF